VALNNEIQEHSKERAQWNAERVRIETDAKTDRDALRAEMDEMKRGYETRLNNITTEHVRLQDQVTAERDARLANERESLQKIELLNTRIAELEKERAALIEKVDRLVAQLIQAEMDKAEQAETIDALEAQVTKLAASLNGKADKPGTGELKPETVAKAQEQAESEV
jgi:chromosome segregation ATPase